MPEAPPPNPAAAPRITIDLHGPFPALSLHTAMAWPHDPKKRQRVFAFYASAALAQNSDRATVAAPWIDQRLKAVAEQRGGTVVDLIAELGGEEVRQNLVDILGSKLDHTLYHDVFLPAGGHHVVSSGPGMEVLKGEIDTAFAEGRWVGQMLCFVRQIEEHHPELRASLRKAWAIVAAERKHQDPNAGTDHSRFLQTAWPRKRCVGPLYAGLLIVLSLRGKVPGHMQPELTQDEVGEVVAYAMWLREWAANFKPFHSNGEPLINPFEAAEYDCPVSPIEPPLGQLSADRLKWLRQRAKRPKPVLHSRKRNVVSAEID